MLRIFLIIASSKHHSKVTQDGIIISTARNFGEDNTYLLLSTIENFSDAC